MFTKILIANRGEIACRVIRTLKKMDIRSVVVYTAADADSLHVSLADEAYYIGHGVASESYLDTQKILDIAIKSGAQAVHPGYGFLSENAAFADAIETCCSRMIWTSVGNPGSRLQRGGGPTSLKILSISAS